jgi:hypothetical protein
VLSIAHAAGGASPLRGWFIETFDFSAIEANSRVTTCFFCIGVSSAGAKEADYRRVTYDITLAAYAPLNLLPDDDIYVSGTGTDSSERPQRGPA